ncbi:hypothetical protein N7454_004866 [Penicillium verhagenii]|nr:hypothetical protein N7454_004866 [Penicillium verhagenii]
MPKSNNNNHHHQTIEVQLRHHPHPEPARGTKRPRHPSPPKGLPSTRTAGAGPSASAVPGPGEGDEAEGSAEAEAESSRKHGKRLTTLEEVSLFEICNRHASSFGKRSDICNWWRGVAEEFTRAHGRPYSWHSVRRKVELVTKQRVKFLKDRRQQQENQNQNQNRLVAGGSHVQAQAQLSEDSMNPQWCGVLDLWIPTWRRWQEAEAKRIEKRDEIVKRRRVSQGQVLVQVPVQGHGRAEGSRNAGSRSSSSDGDGLDGAGGFHDEEGGAETIAAAASLAGTHPYGGGAGGGAQSTPVSLPAGVKLPPGFESMYSNPNPKPSFNLQTSQTSLQAPGRQKRLQAQRQPQSQPQMPGMDSPNLYRSGPNSLDIERIKEELRQEMRLELRRELDQVRTVYEKLDSLQRTQEMILQMLRPGSN